jgi:SsrA-binding protein
MASHKDTTRRSIAQNRKARHHFLILDELEAGVVLQGTEVKSLRDGKCSLQEAFVTVKQGELWLINAHIPEYAFGNVMNHKPTRPRKLLLHRREIDKWGKAAREQGITMVPLEIYFQGSRVKLALALVKGKKLYDKRQSEKAKDDRRSIDRAMKRR